MLNRRVTSDSAGPAGHQNQPAVPDRGELGPRHQGRPLRLRRLDQNLVLAGLGEHEEPAIALGRDGGQRGLGKPRPIGPVGPCLESKTLGAPEHFRNADVGGSKPVTDLIGISRNALEAQQRHEGFEPRIGWSRAVGVSAHWRSPGLRACLGVLRRRQQRLLIRLRVSDRRRSVAGAGRDEARGHELAQQGETGGLRSTAGIGHRG